MTGRRAAECASAGTTLVSHERRGGRRESGRERAGRTTRKVLPIIAELAISREKYREVGEQLGRNAKFAHAEGRRS